MNRFLENLRTKNPVPFVILYYAVGVVGLIIPATRELFMAFTPISLLLSTLLLLLFHGPLSGRFLLGSLVIFSAGFLLEAAGVATGLIFGEYLYGETLGLKLFHTPIIIGVNWLMLVYCSLHIAGKYVESLYFRAIVAASMMVVYDFALEPSAIYLHMWSWTGSAVPLQNYLAWFVIAIGLNYLAGLLKLNPKENKLAMPMFFIQLGFFILLDIWIFVGGVWG